MQVNVTIVGSHTYSNKCAMSLFEEIFDAFGQANVFNTLNLQFSFHQLLLKEGDKVKKTFWRIDLHRNDSLYQLRFLSFGLKNTLIKFQKVRDKMLVGFGFVKCYINDIIVYSLTSRNHKHASTKGVWKT